MVGPVRPVQERVGELSDVSIEIPSPPSAEVIITFPSPLVGMTPKKKPPIVKVATKTKILSSFFILKFHYFY